MNIRRWRYALRLRAGLRQQGRGSYLNFQGSHPWLRVFRPCGPRGHRHAAPRRPVARGKAASDQRSAISHVGSRFRVRGVGCSEFGVRRSGNRLFGVRRSGFGGWAARKGDLLSIVPGVGTPGYASFGPAGLAGSCNRPTAIMTERGDGGMGRRPARSCETTERHQGGREPRRQEQEVRSRGRLGNRWRFENRNARRKAGSPLESAPHQSAGHASVVHGATPCGSAPVCGSKEGDLT